ncbi:unnamed protein product [Caenorhabditis sp. 36 PRJEB53466]|nr:unnamed protein product [Caenorhabditis sp. 36 PRJEB53466]
MPDDAYEFLGPDLLAPPPPPTGSTTPNGTPIPDVAQQPVNELAPASTAEKFQVQPAAPETRKGSASYSKESATKRKGANKKKGVSKGSKAALHEDLPSLSAFKCQMVFSAVAVFASVGLTLMVLIDGLM